MDLINCHQWVGLTKCSKIKELVFSKLSQLDNLLHQSSIITNKINLSKHHSNNHNISKCKVNLLLCNSKCNNPLKCNNLPKCNNPLKCSPSKCKVILLWQTNKLFSSSNSNSFMQLQPNNNNNNTSSNLLLRCKMGNTNNTRTPLLK